MRDMILFYLMCKTNSFLPTCIGKFLKLSVHFVGYYFILKFIFIFIIN